VRNTTDSGLYSFVCYIQFYTSVDWIIAFFKVLNSYIPYMLTHIGLFYCTDCECSY